MSFQSPLGLFSVLWALAASLHHLEAQPLVGLPLYPFALLLLLFPERIWAIASFAAAHAALLSIDLPAAANHSALALLVDGGLLVGCCAAARSAQPHRPERLWEGIRGPMKATLAVVYFFTVFDKLNSSFLDPATSCAVLQLARIFPLHGLAGPTGYPEAFAFNVELTLIAESTILVLLLWPRFAYLGALIGLAFHTGLAWAQFYDFSTVALALYLFFLPWEKVQRDISRLPGWVRGLSLVCLVCLAATSLFFLAFRGDAIIASWPHWTLRAETLICAFWTLMIWPILLPLFWHGPERRADRPWPGTALAWLIPLLALANGATSYLGLKTVTNYSMFSNLRTEGGRTNHLLIPADLLFVADYQHDLVRVPSLGGKPPGTWPAWIRLVGGTGWLRRNARWLDEGPGARVPFTEVRRCLHLWRAAGMTELSIEYERGGKRYVLEDAFADPEISRPLPWWERKLFAFRAVEDDGQESRCRW